jgi:3-hydroxybutyryl-CoA dehydrogenase
MKIDRIAVVGAGTMGNGIAHVAAQHGRSVVLVDVASEALDRARATISTNLDRQIKKGVVEASAKEATLERIELSTDLASAAERVALVRSRPC